VAGTENYLAWLNAGLRGPDDPGPVPVPEAPAE